MLFGVYLHTLNINLTYNIITMAKQAGLIRLTGTMGDISFYKTKAGYLAKQKSSLTKARVMKDPAFAGSRKAGTEFGRGAEASANLRHAFFPAARKAKDWSTHFRLNKLMTDIVRSDPWHRKGERVLGAGKVRSLKGFEWNEEQRFSNIFEGCYTARIDAETGRMKVTVAPFKAAEWKGTPKECTHIQLRVGGTALGAADDRSNICLMKSEYLPVGEETEEMVFEMEVPVVAGVLQVLGMGVVFYQEVSGEFYDLKEGACFAVVDVDVVRDEEDMVAMGSEKETRDMGEDDGMMMLVPKSVIAKGELNSDGLKVKTKVINEVDGKCGEHIEGKTIKLENVTLDVMTENTSKEHLVLGTKKDSTKNIMLFNYSSGIRIHGGKGIYRNILACMLLLIGQQCMGQDTIKELKGTGMYGRELPKFNGYTAKQQDSLQHDTKVMSDTVYHGKYIKTRR